MQISIKSVRKSQIEVEDMERLILSLDIGSSSCKAVLFDEFGRELGIGKGYYSFDTISFNSYTSHIEQHPEEIWNGVCQAIVQLGKQNSNISKIQAITLTAQISSHFLIDRECNPLTNIVSWRDSRALEESNELKAAFTPKELLDFLGADLPIGPSWPIPKLRWFRKHEPEILEKSMYLVQPKEWVLWKLSSQWATDLSSVRGIVNQITGQVCKPLLEWAGVTRDIVPPVKQPYETIGILDPLVAEKLCLPAGTPVILGWNDFNASVLGTIGLAKGIQGFDITGTSEHLGVLDSTHATLQDPKHTGLNWIPFLHHHQLIYGATSSGGQALKWYVENFDQFGKTSFDYHSVMNQAQEISPGAEGLLFIPYLNGERAPWWNSSLKGNLWGMTLDHDRRHFARAVLEGVGYALRTIYERIETPPKEIKITGGLSRLSLWNQIKADMLGVPIIQSETEEGGALGAAILAAFGLGWYRSLEEACEHMVRDGERVEPNEKAAAFYEEGYQTFLRVFHALEPVIGK